MSEEAERAILPDEIALKKIFDVLEPFTDDERKRILQTVFVFYGFPVPG